MFRHVCSAVGSKHASSTPTSIRLELRCPPGDIGSVLKSFRLERSRGRRNGPLLGTWPRCISSGRGDTASAYASEPTTRSKVRTTVSARNRSIRVRQLESAAEDHESTGQSERDTEIKITSDPQKLSSEVIDDANADVRRILDPTLASTIQQNPAERSKAQQKVRIVSGENILPSQYRVVFEDATSAIVRNRVLSKALDEDAPISEQSSIVRRVRGNEWKDRQRARRSRTPLPEAFTGLFADFGKLINAKSGPGPPLLSDPSITKLLQLQAQISRRFITMASRKWILLLETNRAILWYFVTNFEKGSMAYMQGAIGLVMTSFAKIVKLLESRQVEQRTALDIITRACNNILAKIFFSIDAKKPSSLQVAYRCQSKLVNAMVSTIKPEIPMTRRGYRALIALQLVYPPNTQELDWRSLQASSWPPWRIGLSGVDENIEENVVRSRAQKLLRQMQQDGYSWRTWEKCASILSGWNLDDTPTIAKPIYLSLRYNSEAAMDQLDDLQNPMIWEAKIQATRNLHEAWAMYLSAEEHGVQNSRVQSIIIERLIADNRRKRNDRGRTSMEFNSLRREIYRGRLNLDIQPPPKDPRYLAQIDRRVPGLSEFLDELRLQGFRQSVKVTNLLLLNSQNWVDFGHHLRHCGDKTINAMQLLSDPLSLTKDQLAVVDKDMLLIFQRRLLESGPPTATDCYTLGISNQHWTGYHASAILVFVHFTNTGVVDDSFVCGSIVQFLARSPLTQVQTMLSEATDREHVLAARRVFYNRRNEIKNLIETASDLLSQPSLRFLDLMTHAIHQMKLMADLIHAGQVHGESTLSNIAFRRWEGRLLLQIDKVFTKTTGTSLTRHRSMSTPGEELKVLPSLGFMYTYFELLKLVDPSKISGLRNWLQTHRRHWHANPNLRRSWSSLLAEVEARESIHATLKHDEKAAEIETPIASTQQSDAV